MASVATNLELNSRVFYTENGEDDAGTVIDIADKTFDVNRENYNLTVYRGQVQVAFDADPKDSEPDWYYPEQLTIME